MMFVKTEPSSDNSSLQHGTSTPTTTTTTTTVAVAAAAAANEQASSVIAEQPPQPENTKEEVDTTVTTTASFPAAAEQVPVSMPIQDDLCLSAMEATIQSVFDALNVLSQQQQQSAQAQQQNQQQSQPQQQKTPPQPQLATSTSLEPGVQPLSSSVTVSHGVVSQAASYPVVTPQPVPVVPELSPAEQLKQQMMKQKIRDENRTRKQRWRVNNEERNKDNDLRCRVNKRSHKLFGTEPSEHKKKWVAEEFQRRRLKRQEKERRKQAVNGALAATNTPSTPMTDDSENATIAQLQHKLLQHYQSLFGMDQQDSEKTKNSTAALVAALQNPQLLQLSQLLAQTVTATTTGSVPPPPPPLHPHVSSIASSTSAATTTSIANNTTSNETSSSSPPSSSSSFISLQHNAQLLVKPKEEDGSNHSKGDNRMELDQSKIDLAAAEIMKQFTSQAFASTVHHLDQSGLGNPATATASESSAKSTITTTIPATTTASPAGPATASSADTTLITTPAESTQSEDTPMEDAEGTKDTTKKDHGTEKKNDYPMDAVMTLMELNAGWRP